jgi:signal transduction histidine kinase
MIRGRTHDPFLLRAACFPLYTQLHAMNINRRRGAIALFITLGVLTLGAAIALNIGWVILNERRIVLLVVGVVFFALLVAGVVLNTVFLVREVRRNERQESFLNAVTHELKTPIASIRLYLETLQRRDVPEAQRQDFYKIMLADSERLLGTVEQVLKAGELGARRRHADRTVLELGPLVADCIAITLQRHHLPEEAIVLEPVPGAVRLHVRGIAEDLRTAVLNLLDNAVKYSPNGVHVSCSIAIVRYTLVALTIHDTGVGLPANQHKRIFKRFYRVPGRNAVRIKGTGLGLFLVRTIARQHGGDIAATSPGPNLGTTITLTLPLASEV